MGLAGSTLCLVFRGKLVLALGGTAWALGRWELLFWEDTERSSKEVFGEQGCGAHQECINAGVMMGDGEARASSSLWQ